jgi:hypothetical protein
LLDAGFGLGLGTGRNTRDGEDFQTEKRRYLQGVHVLTDEARGLVKFVSDGAEGKVGMANCWMC